MTSCLASIHAAIVRFTMIRKNQKASTFVNSGQTGAKHRGIGCRLLFGFGSASRSCREARMVGAHGFGWSVNS